VTLNVYAEVNVHFLVRYIPQQKVETDYTQVGLLSFRITFEKMAVGAVSMIKHIFFRATVLKLYILKVHFELATH